MFDAQVLAFFLVAAVLTITPGADTLLVVRNVLRGGRTQGVVTTAGICSGLFVHATLSALGVSVLLLHSASAFQAVKLAGASYLIWLGAQSLWNALRAGHGGDIGVVPEPTAGEGVGGAGPASARRCFLEGFLTNVLNPKVAVFYLAFLPQFIGPDDPVLGKSLLLASLHVLQGILWLAALSVLVDRSRRFFLRATPRRWIEGVCGAVLLGLGVRLALERR